MVIIARRNSLTFFVFTVCAREKGEVKQSDRNGAGTRQEYIGMSNILGSNFSTDEEKKRAAWEKATFVPGQMYRIDCDGRAIVWDQYGKYGEFGWQIDHIIASVFGGLDELWNLRARHWMGNSQAGGLAGVLATRLRQI
jgi:hypothetical protein